MKIGSSTAMSDSGMEWRLKEGLLKIYPLSVI